MKRYMLGIFGAVLIAGVAFAVAEQRVDMTGSVFPMWITGGLYVGPKSPNPTNDKLNKLTRMPACACDEDFPPILTKFVNLNPNPCTCKGVRIGDPCLVGVTSAAPSDGGSAQWLGAVVTAIARGTDLVEIDILNASDAGTIDPPDSGYNVRCFSNVAN